MNDRWKRGVKTFVAVPILAAAVTFFNVLPASGEVVLTRWPRRAMFGLSVTSPAARRA